MALKYILVVISDMKTAPMPQPAIEALKTFFESLFISKAPIAIIPPLKINMLIILMVSVMVGKATTANIISAIKINIDAITPITFLPKVFSRSRLVCLGRGSGMGFLRCAL